MPGRRSVHVRGILFHVTKPSELTGTYPREQTFSVLYIWKQWQGQRKGVSWLKFAFYTLGNGKRKGELLPSCVYQLARAIMAKCQRMGVLKTKQNNTEFIFSVHWGPGHPGWYGHRCLLLVLPTRIPRSGSTDSVSGSSCLPDFPIAIFLSCAHMDFPRGRVFYEDITTEQDPFIMTLCNLCISSEGSSSNIATLEPL